jgi:hypothetical protein
MAAFDYFCKSGVQIYIMNYLRLFLLVFTKPGLAFSRIKEEQLSHGLLFLLYAMPLLVFASLGRMSQPMGLQEDMTLAYAVFLIHICATATSMWLGAWMISRLSPSFHSERHFPHTLKMIVLSYTPFLLAQGLSFLLPESWPVGIIGLIYTVYLFGLALPLVLQTPRERLIGFTLISFFVLLGISYGLSLMFSGMVIFVE